MSKFAIQKNLLLISLHWSGHEKKGPTIFNIQSALEAVKLSGWALKECTKELRNNQQVVLAAVEQDGSALAFAEPDLLQDKNFVLQAIKKDAFALLKASKGLQKDQCCALEAAKQNGNVLQHLALEFQEDREVVLAAVNSRGGALKFASNKLRADKAVVIAAVRDDYRAIDYALDLQNDAEVMAALITHKSSASNYLDQYLKKLDNKSRALKDASEALRANKEFVLAAVKNDGMELQYASEALRADEDVIIEALRNNIKALDHVPEAVIENFNLEEREILLDEENKPITNKTAVIMMGNSLMVGKRHYSSQDLEDFVSSNSKKSCPIVYLLYLLIEDNNDNASYLANKLLQDHPKLYLYFKQYFPPQIVSTLTDPTPEQLAAKANKKTTLKPAAGPSSDPATQSLSPLPDPATQSPSPKNPTASSPTSSPNNGASPKNPTASSPTSSPNNGASPKKSNSSSVALVVIFILVLVFLALGFNIIHIKRTKLVNKKKQPVNNKSVNKKPMHNKPANKKTNS